MLLFTLFCILYKYQWTPKQTSALHPKANNSLTWCPLLAFLPFRYAGFAILVCFLFFLFKTLVKTNRNSFCCLYPGTESKLETFSSRFWMLNSLFYDKFHFVMDGTKHTDKHTYKQMDKHCKGEGYILLFYISEFLAIRKWDS